MKQYTTEFYFLMALITGAFVLAFFIFKPFIVPLIFAVVFATVFNPLYRRILRWTGEKRRGLAALLATTSVLLIAVVPLTFLTVQIFKELTQFYLFLASPGGTELITRVEDIVVGFRDFIPGAADFSFDTGEYTGRVLNWSFAHLSSFLGSLFSVLVSLFIFLISLFYLFKDGETLQREAIKISPLQDAYDREIFKKLEQSVNSVVRGNLTVALVQGVLTSIGFLIFGVPSPALWGGVAAMAALIPSFGTSLVIVPAVLFLFAIGATGSALGLVLWGAVAVGLIDNFLGPKLVEKGIRIHPFLILLSVLGGLGVFGPIGFLLGPLTLSLLYALLDIFATVRRRQGV